jgi:hypothetical protein
LKLKKTLFCFSISLILFSFSASAFNDGDTIRVHPFIKKKKTFPFQPLVLKTSPAAFLWGGVPLTSEYRLMAEITTGRTQSDELGISYLGKNVAYGAFEKLNKTSNARTLKVSGWRFIYAHKFYLVNHRHHSPYGFYVAPLFSYTNAHISLGLNRYYHQTYYDFRHFNANLVLGIQTGKFKRLTMDIYAGGGYKSNTVYYHASSFNIFKFDTTDFGKFYNGHLNLIFDINLGYSF